MWVNSNIVTFYLFLNDHMLLFFIILLCLQVMVLTFCFYQKLIFCRKLFLCCCVYRWMVYLILMIINRLTCKVIIANNFSAAMFTVAWVICPLPDGNHHSWNIQGIKKIWKDFVCLDQKKGFRQKRLLDIFPWRLGFVRKH